MNIGIASRKLLNCPVVLFSQCLGAQFVELCGADALTMRSLFLEFGHSLNGEIPERRIIYPIHIYILLYTLCFLMVLIHAYSS